MLFDPEAAAMSCQASQNYHKFKPATKNIEPAIQPAISILNSQNKFQPFHQKCLMLLCLSPQLLLLIWSRPE